MKKRKNCRCYHCVFCRARVIGNRLKREQRRSARELAAKKVFICPCGTCLRCRHRRLVAKLRWWTRFRIGYDGPPEQPACATALAIQALEGLSQPSWMLRGRRLSGILQA